MLDTFHRMSLFCKRISLFEFYFTAGLSVSTLIWGKAALAVTNAEHLVFQAELRGLKVLPPYGDWVTEANYSSASMRGLIPFKPFPRFVHNPQVFRCTNGLITLMSIRMCYGISPCNTNMSIPVVHPMRGQHAYVS